MTANTEYFDRAARGYLRSGRTAIWGVVRLIEWAKVRDCLELAPGLEVLDAGCGAGHYSLLLREAGAKVTGFDLSPGMVAAYREQGFAGTVASMEAFRTEARFDRVLAAGVLEFVERPAAAIENMARLLKGGGRLVFLVPRAGLAGAAYRAAHKLMGCPALVRRPEFYAELAKGCGLEQAGPARGACFSRVLVFRKPL